MSQAQEPAAPAPAAASPPAASPPAAETGGASGTISGTVLDKSSSYPVVGALIEVVGQKRRTESDLDGKFHLALPRGTYSLRITADLYAPTTIKEVQVSPSRVTTVNASLPPNRAGNVQVVEVKELNKASEETQLVQRKEAATVSEVIGAESMKKSGDSDAAQAVTRVPAVTLKDDKFIVVRGLSERYSSGLLNGSRLPSTDPNRRAVPLDLFPADFIESLNLVKAYSPDLPGDFSGGLIDIRLAEPPRELTYGVGVSLEINTETTFQDYDTYDSTWKDWFTLGDEFRDLPDIFGDGNIGGNIPTSQQQAYVSSLPINWNTNSQTAPPNFSLDGSVGNSWGPFGINLAATYGWKFSVHRGEVQNSFLSTQEIDNDQGEFFTYDVSDFETELGAVLTTNYLFSTDHKLFGRALVNRQSVDEVQVGAGRERPETVEQFPSSSIYTSNQLGLGQLEGRHRFAPVHLDWRASWAPSNQDVPDAKYYRYEAPDEPGVEPALTDRQRSLQRTYTNLSEFLQDYYVDATLPFDTRLPFTDAWRGLRARAKAGLAYSLRDRDFLFRSYITQRLDNFPRDFLTQPPDSVLRPEYYGTNGLDFSNAEFEPFNASQEIAAAYGMLDLPIIEDQLRLIGGSRVEYSYLTTRSRAPLGGGGSEAFENTILNDLDPMPSVNLIYNPRDDMNIRAAFSQTVSRPEFRELTPTRLPVLPGQRPLIGNQGLISSHITNYDLRWEWFFTPLELTSAGFFYKEIEDPIERVTVADSTSAIDTFANSTAATVWGFEFEVRKDFAFLTKYAAKVSWLESVAPRLADFQLLVNASVIESSVPADEFSVPPREPFSDVSVAGDRRLQGQSPYIINLAAQYEDDEWGVFRLLYNTTGTTLIAAGTDFAASVPGVTPDINEEQRNQLDFVWLVPIEPFGIPLTGKFAVDNILNDVYLQTQGDQTVSRYRTGATFSFGASYSF